MMDKQEIVDFTEDEIFTDATDRDMSIVRISPGVHVARIYDMHSDSEGCQALRVLFMTVTLDDLGDMSSRASTSAEIRECLAQIERGAV